MIATAAELVGVRLAQATGVRFVDDGDGTVVDKERQLQWETMDEPDGVAQLSDPHDADNGHSWGPVLAPYPADGTAYTDFLAKLNGGGGSCFAGHCDWRLPTVGELEGIAGTGYFTDGGSVHYRSTATNPSATAWHTPSASVARGPRGRSAS
jgi:hypothetical protein